jgi:hypothetical protein
MLVFDSNISMGFIDISKKNEEIENTHFRYLSNKKCKYRSNREFRVWIDSPNRYLSDHTSFDVIASPNRK